MRAKRTVSVCVQGKLHRMFGCCYLLLRSLTHFPFRHTQEPSDYRNSRSGILVDWFSVLPVNHGRRNTWKLGIESETGQKCVCAMPKQRVCFFPDAQTGITKSFFVNDNTKRAHMSTQVVE